MISLLVVLLALCGIAAERIWPARELPHVRGWWARAVALNLVQVLAVILVGSWLDPWLQGHPLGQGLRALSPWAQGGLAYLAGACVYYFWHRARHASPWLWRVLHQTHHAPERIEVSTSFYKHPLEGISNALISSALTFLVLGCSIEGAAVYTFLAGSAELFYHLNLRTPRWLGYLIQRPEMHRIHHMRGHHAHNYGDLPVLDLLFGTFWNPPEGFEVVCGLGPAQEDRFEDQLLGRDLAAFASQEPARFLPGWIGAARPARPAEASRA